jgi:hypothetical protein
MKRRLAAGSKQSKMTRITLLGMCLATLLAFALVSSNGIAARGPVSVVSLAPADQYFGREHLSPLGIRHTIFSLKDDLHHARRKPDAVEHAAIFVQDAVEDWYARYPRDPWIPASAWNLAVLFEELPGTDAQAHAVTLLQELHERFAGTPFADDASRDLARGIGVRPWPKWAGTPAPTADAVTDAGSLLRAIQAISAVPAAQQPAAAFSLEDRFLSLSRQGADPAYARAAWQLAAAFEQLPGEAAQTQAIRLLALLVDRYPSVVFGKWAMRDLKRGIGARSTPVPAHV